ncbi:hypothetical protein [Streptomyces sp. NPDC057438]|uniref:hypothetical protein n=1 Tax=Streptomyces sp. NPDC057438 TaxID=3346133 RepID=UPI0036D0E39E
MRGTTTRTVLSALAAVLLALTFFAPAASFAAAHTLGHTKAKAEPGNTPRAKPVRDKTATHRTCAPAQDPIGPLRTRDRHRAAPHPLPGAPARPPAEENPAATSRSGQPSPRHHPAARSRTAHTPAALQVFRC